MIKRFLVPVLALAALGLPARASIVTYCDGASPTCTNSSASFSNAGMLAIDFTSATIVNNSFTDPLSGTAFYDYLGGTMTDSSDTLFDTKAGFQINVPDNTMLLALDFKAAAGTWVISFNTDSGATFSSFAIPSTGSYQFFAVSSTTAITNLLVYDNTTNGSISNFQLQGQAQTPEVGTLILIGAGLISMRWMKRLPKRLAKPRFFRSPQTV